MSEFWIQPNNHYSYSELLTDIRDTSVPQVIYEEEPYDIWVQLLRSIVAEKDVTLLDPELPIETIENMGFDIQKRQATTTVQSDQVSFDEPTTFLNSIKDANWELTLFTSGTTGKPTKVRQTLSALTRSVRTSNRHDDDIWAFAYNPTHMAGLQVFFQAIYNLNPMVYIFEAKPATIAEQFQIHEITHVSATPTFYRLKLRQIDGSFPTVERLTSGGERFQSDIRDQISSIFPNAQLRNVYALTETGTILESEGETFEIPPDKIDKFEISEDDELLLHESLLGEGEYEDVDGEWFHTGDLVDMVDDRSFRFVGRNSELVNVGGYQVNPNRIEDLIRVHPEVMEVAVYPRENSVTGNILVADVVIDGDNPDTITSQIRGRLDEKLESYRQPRIINVVDTIEISRTGKKQRS